MVLTNEELQKIVFGKVKSFTDENGYTVFRRFTDRQYDYLKGRDFGPRVDATAGIFLEVEGEVKRISFEYELKKGSSRLYSNMDILENGKLVSTFDLMTESWFGSFSYEPKESGRLKIAFPNRMTLCVKNVSIEGSYAPGRRDRKFYISGDSITQGYDAEHPSMSYANAVTEYFHAECVNQSIGGDMFHEELIDPEVPFFPDTVIIAYGTNDWKHSLPLEANSDAYLRKLRDVYRTADIFVLIPIWRESGKNVNPDTGLTLQDAREIIRLTALKNGCVPIDCSKFVTPDHKYYSDDPALHPNDHGMTEYAQHLIEVLRESI